MVALFECKSDSLLEERQGELRVLLAQNMQKNFETKTADDRAKKEPMPCTKYLDRSGLVVNQTVFAASMARKALYIFYC